MKTLKIECKKDAKIITRIKKVKILVGWICQNETEDKMRKVKN